MKEIERELYLEIRKDIENKEFLDDIIYNKLIRNDIINKCSLLLTYVSTKNEVDTLRLIKYYLYYKSVAVPKVEDNDINFYYINSLNDLSIGSYNILEPTTNKKVYNYSNSVCITPGIVFSKDNYRIGYGKGFYDRFFDKHDTYSIGLCYSKCLVKKLDHDKYDRKVNKVITD